MEDDKTSTYSADNKTSSYGDSKKLTKESVHNLKAGDNITLNKKDYKIPETVSEITGKAVMHKIENYRQKAYAFQQTNLMRIFIICSGD